MLDEKYIANRIKELCDRKQMTMYALSKKTGISQSSLSNLMKRGSTPTFYTLERICDGYIEVLIFHHEGTECNQLVWAVTGELGRVL